MKHEQIIFFSSQHVCLNSVYLHGGFIIMCHMYMLNKNISLCYLHISFEPKLLLFLFYLVIICEKNINF